MTPEAPRFVGSIAPDRPLVQRQLGLLQGTRRAFAPSSRRRRVLGNMPWPSIAAIEGPAWSTSANSQVRLCHRFRAVQSRVKMEAVTVTRPALADTFFSDNSPSGWAISQGFLLALHRFPDALIVSPFTAMDNWLRLLFNGRNAMESLRILAVRKADCYGKRPSRPLVVKRGPKSPASTTASGSGA